MSLIFCYTQYLFTSYNVMSECVYSEVTFALPWSHLLPSPSLDLNTTLTEKESQLGIGERLWLES